MVHIVQEYVRNAPEKPGVYKMISSQGNVLYIGKAKNIKKRLSQYTQALSNRLQIMISQVEKIEVITTRNEVEALILEAQLIRKLQPKYNITLKDDKSYPYAMITSHSFPRLMKYRGIYHKGCYGPFTSTDKLHETISTLHKTFLLRSCSDFMFAKRKRPCIEYQIKRCSAPCVGRISQHDYNQTVKQAIEILQGKTHQVQNKLTKLMDEASQSLDYEKAAVYRDRIRLLQYLQSHQQTIEAGDVIGIYQEMDTAHIQILSFLNNRLQDQCFYVMNNLNGSTLEEVISTFIIQHYQNSAPKEIFSNYQPSPTAISALEKLCHHKVHFYVPKKGDKFKIVQTTFNNAQQHFQRNNIKYCLKLIQKIFSLEKIPDRIEVYDNSHTSGYYPIGVMIVIDNAKGFNKREYKKFTISKNTADDYFMMQEVLIKRLQTQPYADFMLIDGGIGHMSVIKNILQKIPFACISKGEKRNAGDEFFHTPNMQSFQLEKDSMISYFLQNIRDEAHRFAITSHRKKRDSSIKISILDSIPGIGQHKKKLLLTHFGSAEAIKQSSINQLTNIKGINTKTAEIILKYLYD